MPNPSLDNKGYVCQVSSDGKNFLPLGRNKQGLYKYVKQTD